MQIQNNSLDSACLVAYRINWLAAEISPIEYI